MEWAVDRSVESRRSCLAPFADGEKDRSFPGMQKQAWKLCVVSLWRLTLVIDSGMIDHVFYPVFRPDQNASEVVSWLAARTRVHELEAKRDASDSRAGSTA